MMAGLLTAARLDELRAAGLVRPASRLRPDRPSPPQPRAHLQASPPRSDQTLDELRAAGLVRVATDPGGVGVDQSLPVAAALRPLLPGGGLRRGSTIAVATPGLPREAMATGATSLLYALLAEASAAGSWCAG